MKNKISSIPMLLTLLAFIAVAATAHADKGVSSSNKGPNTNNVPGMNQGPNTNNCPNPNQGPNTNNCPSPNQGPNTNNVANDGVEIVLVAGPDFKGAKGVAEFRSRVGHQQFEVEVQVPKSLAGAILNVSVDTMLVGTITVDVTGHGELELEAEHGTTVPAVQAGSLVGVTDSADDIVLAGQF